MQIQTQTRADRAHIAHLIEDQRVAMLTTVEADGALVSRPMSALEMDVSGALWFFTDARSAKVDRLAAVNVAFSDESHGLYVSLSGHGEINKDRLRIQRLWTVLAQPWFPDGPDSRDLALLKFVPNTADYWDAPHSTMIRAFGMLASVIAGKPIGLGDQGSHHHLTANQGSAP